MADEENQLNPVFTPSHLVTLTPIPHSTTNQRRLSSRFTKPKSPIKSGSTRKSLGMSMAWVSLQGRIVGAEEATSARAIKGGLTRHEAVAWELFSPIHRVLIVAVVAVAASKCEKNRQIQKLKNCVELRDQILMSMQQKLDNLCEEMNHVKDQSEAIPAAQCGTKTVDVSSTEPSFPCNSDSICTDCWLCEQHRTQLNYLSVTQGNTNVKAGSTDEVFRRRLSVSNEAEQEERRMSDLSDWAASSVTSAADMQLNNLAMEQDTYNLKKECEEKDAAIKELSAFIRSKDAATSKIEDLEEIIRRKNTVITRLRKDMLVLEQKIVSLTRMRRRSYSGPAELEKKLPMMTDNLLYDMDSTTSPSSSSDSDSNSKKQHASRQKTEKLLNTVNFTVETENMTKRHRQSAPPSITCSTVKPSTQIPSSRPVTPHVKTEELLKTVNFTVGTENVTKRHRQSAPPNIPCSSSSRAATPLKEKSLNLRLGHSPSNAGVGNSRRRSSLNASKETAPSKRWM